ncbi:MAG: heterodisulfide reductase-related iron-sulfur binding cluster [Pseudomonadota bacterium]
MKSCADKPDAEVLFWVGCAASYDDRAKKIARSTAQLLLAAGVDFAILAEEETCTGDPARRAGNEYLFTMLAETNAATLNGYKAQGGVKRSSPPARIASTHSRTNTRTLAPSSRSCITPITCSSWWL